MSIATSVLISPSRIMRRLLLCITGCICVVWFCVAYWFLLYADLHVGILEYVVVFFLLYVVLRTLLHPFSQSITFRLEVSNDGDILLHRIDVLGRVVASGSVKLRSPLILWSSLLVLTLQNESGKVIRLLILHDSVSGAGFRRLSLAFHWLAHAKAHTSVHNDLSEGNF